MWLHGLTAPDATVVAGAFVLIGGWITVAKDIKVRKMQTASEEKARQEQREKDDQKLAQEAVTAKQIQDAKAFTELAERYSQLNSDHVTNQKHLLGLLEFHIAECERLTEENARLKKQVAVVNPRHLRRIELEE